MTFILGCKSHGMYNKLDSSYYRKGDRHCRDHKVVGFITSLAISAYLHENCEFEPRIWRGVLDTILCDKVCQ